MRKVVFGALWLVTACLDVTVPPVPSPPGPGSIQGTVVYSVPGRTSARPAGGATIALVGSSRRTTADADTGRFELEGITRSTGQLLITFDADGDGTVDRQKVFELSALGAGRGKTVALGEVSLGRNGSIVGRVLRDDVSGASGHAGTAAFVAGLPLATASSDLGDFVLENLPEGPVTVSFFRAGYLAETADLDVRAGQEAQASTLRLKVDPLGAMAAPARVTGTLRFEDDTPVANAQLQLVSGPLRVRTSTSATGAFTAEVGQAALFQVGIEAEGAQSLILTNVLLLPGTTDLGVVALARGTSTPVDFDGGFNPGTPDAGPGVIAAIDPPVLELAPGATGTVSSARSLGTRPLTSRWRSSSDGGLLLAFEAPVTTGATTRVTAPDAAGLFTIGLEVVDPTGTTSSEARSLVRVGRAPTVTLDVDDGGTRQVETGDPLTLLASAQSSDGRAISEFRWTQLTGPAVPGVTTTLGPTLTFTAPPVSAAIPFTFEVVARTDLGFESPPARVTVGVRPRGAPLLTVTAMPPSVSWLGGPPTTVTLTASLSGAAPRDTIEYRWAIVDAGACPLPDGGLDLTCPSAVTLSNDTGPTTAFFSPQVSGNRELRFVATARGSDGGVLGVSDLAFPVADRRPPACRSFGSPLWLQVQCDERISALPRLDAGPNTPLHSVAVDGGLAVFFFETAPSGPFTFEVSGVADPAGNAPSALALPSVLGISPSQVYTSSLSSLTNPRPMWVTPPASTGAPTSRFVVARGTTASERAVWQWAPEGGCGQPMCELFAMPIPMAGVDPGPALASVAAGRRAFLITSQTNPNALVEVSGGVPAEFPVMTMPRLYGLSAAGNDVWVLTRSDAGALERRRLSGGPFDGGLLGPPDEVNPSFSGTVADVFTSPDGREAAAGVDEATSLFQYRLQDPFSSTWGPAGELTFPSANTVVGVRGAWLGPLPGQPVWLTVDSMGVLRIDGEAPFPATRFTHTLSMSAAPFVDAVRFGNAVLVAWVTFGGELRLSLMSTVLASPPVDVLNAVGQTRWNDTEPAVSPRLTLMDGEVLLTWSVGMGAGPWRLKARTLR